MQSAAESQCTFFIPAKANLSQVARLRSSLRSSSLLDDEHTDLHCLIRSPSASGARYFILMNSAL